MTCFPGFFTRFLAGLYLFCAWGLAAGGSGSYEAPLPVQLSTDPDLCAYVPCKDVLPGADSFSHRMGKPAYVEAYQSKKSGPSEKGDRGRKDGHDEKGDHGNKGDHGEKNDRKLIGYVFLSTDIVDIPAYSGKPVVTLMAWIPRASSLVFGFCDTPSRSCCWESGRGADQVRQAISRQICGSRLKWARVGRIRA